MNSNSSTVRSVVWAIVALLAVIIVALTCVAVTGNSVDTLTTFITASVIPTVAVLVNVSLTQQAAKASEQTVKNTNGNMSRLLDILEANGIEAPDGYEQYRGKYADKE